MSLARRTRSVVSVLSPALAIFPHAACLLLLAACGGSVGSDVVARVDGEEVAYGGFEATLRASVEGSELSLESEVLSRLFDQYLDDLLLIRLAVDRGLSVPEPSERQAIEFLLQGVDEGAVSAGEVEAYYREHLESFERPRRVHLRQILVSEAAAAEEAKAALDSGEDFAAVASRFSIEPNASLGGDQGQLGRADLPASFVDIIFALGEAEVSEIVEADYGLHIFQVVAHLPAEVVPLSQVEEEIRRTLLGQHVDEVVVSLVAEARERYNVRVFSSSFPFEYQGDYDR